jgi:ATP-dependent RNA helicase RhlE
LAAKQPEDCIAIHNAEVCPIFENNFLMNNFSELSLSSVLRSNLGKHGFVTPTPVQAQAIPPALDGRDIVATAQTGTGKTLAFVVPMLQILAQKPAGGVKALILSPTRELAIQINETFSKLAVGTGMKAAVVVGGLSESNQLRAINHGAQVLIATPGRLCDFLKRRLAPLGGVQILVLDEADRMLDMGFLPSIHQILKAVPHAHQTMFFSATIEKSVAHLIESHVKNPVRISIGAITKPIAEVALHVYQVEQDRKLSLLAHLLREDTTGSFLVFTRTKHGADRLADNLARTGVKAARIHGNRSQGQRNQALSGFKDGLYRVLVATDVAARGIHVDGIAHVVNYDLPQVPEDFIHRVGRTGRAGALGLASTFSTRAEQSEVRKIEKELRVNLIRCQVSADIQPAVIAVPAPAPWRERVAEKRSLGRRSFKPAARRRYAA